jgi:hypothetical protein
MFDNRLRPYTKYEKAEQGYAKITLTVIKRVLFEYKLTSTCPCRFGSVGQYTCLIRD